MSTSTNGNTHCYLQFDIEKLNHFISCCSDLSKGYPHTSNIVLKPESALASLSSPISSQFSCHYRFYLHCLLILSSVALLILIIFSQTVRAFYQVPHIFPSHPLPLSFFSACIFLGYKSDLFPSQPSPLATLYLQNIPSISTWPKIYTS